jgi:Ca2+-binding RTX toxin-like protein
MLLLVAAVMLASASKSRADSTVTLPSSLTVTADAPAITLGDVSVLGPTTARITATIDPHLQGTVRVVYGTNGELNLSTPPITLPAAMDAVQQVLDLVGLPTGQTIDYRVVVDTPLGTAASVGGQFTTPDARLVSLATGITGSGKKASCTIVGTAGNDVLIGTKKKDVICGLGGNDRINGMGGNDVVLGGPGKDRVTGGAGRDRIRGNAGGDRLSGNSGNDRIYGGSGKDNLNGGAGNDYLVGNSSKDKVAGASGNDRIQVSDRRGGDRVSGGAGRDRAIVNRGDRVHGVERTSRR